eukprot:8796092-Pyramimonas_sp.AAC.1
MVYAQHRDAEDGQGVHWLRQNGCASAAAFHRRSSQSQWFRRQEASEAAANTGGSRAGWRAGFQWSPGCRGTERA